MHDDGQTETREVGRGVSMLIRCLISVTRRTSSGTVLFTQRVQRLNFLHTAALATVAYENETTNVCTQRR